MARRPVRTHAWRQAGATLPPLGQVAEDFSGLVRVRRLVTWERRVVEPRVRVRN